MRTSYTVWEWSPFTGWTLYAGSSSYATADQVRRAMKYAEPQKFYGVYGAYNINTVYEIVGTWRGYNYSWGWTDNRDRTAEMVYALNMTLRPDVSVWAKTMTSGQLARDVDDQIPYWWRQAILDRKRAAGIAV